MGCDSVHRFVLTAEEKKLILFVLVAFLIGITVKLYRGHYDRDRPAKPPPAHTTAAN
jgi:hypothetical protein